MSRTETVAVVGAGAIGCLLAAAMAGGGHHVLLVCRRPGQAAAINDNGVRVIGAGGETALHSVTACTALDDPVALAFVAVKAAALTSVIGSKALARVDTVIPLLNGLEHVPELRRSGLTVRAGATYAAARQISDHEVEHHSGFRIVLAGQHEEPDRAADLLRSGGFQVQTAPEQQVLWEKFAVVICAASIAALSGLPVGQARTLHQRELVGLASEVAVVSSADGVPLDPDRLLTRIASLPTQMRPSLQLDISSGKPSELDALLGAFIRRAERFGLATPQAAEIHERLKAMEGA